ncbi:twin-arginine translocase TatA/TatE family subunit [Streptomyces aidingensis]|uniref:Sec-independent protein translocase protein TatA n=1 Tax=Streptomyces aidingensis TaxID=910347 RepID=A0A1I1FAQ2_9ACTN|nr:twin-arginine translocase TatA/TatE family subunit [Streptomyces aidingensis]SFB96042.1 sec-independent protein translocase protein TatA [Streptomyces aidingensis]
MGMGNALSGSHLLVLLLVVLVVFGSKRLPEVARGLGQSLRILRAEARAMSRDAAAPQSGGAVPQPLPQTAAPRDERPPAG